MAHNGRDAKLNPRVFFDISIGGQKMGRIVMSLRADVVSRTAENFRCLCTGEKRDAKGKKLTFKGSVFHRVIPGFICQGGDIVDGTGANGLSIYGEAFADENFALKHVGAGILSMANRGRDTNASQFFINLDVHDWLDGKHVVFGSVTDGMDVVKAIEHQGGVLPCVDIKSSRRLRAESLRRSDACSMAWRCRFLTVRPSQHGGVIAEK